MKKLLNRCYRTHFFVCSNTFYFFLSIFENYFFSLNMPVFFEMVKRARSSNDYM